MTSSRRAPAPVGRRNVLLAVMGKLFFDRMIVKDFDKGLANLKTTAETLLRK